MSLPEESGSFSIQPILCRRPKKEGFNILADLAESKIEYPFLAQGIIARDVGLAVNSHFYEIARIAGHSQRASIDPSEGFYANHE